MAETTEALHSVRFPNESDDYRAARNELLDAEVELRQRLVDVAQQRAKLPPGGLVKEDYAFEEAVGEVVRDVKLSELFEDGKDSLILYSFMYGPQMQRPCSLCTSLLDSFNSQAPNVVQRVNLAVIARSPAPRLETWRQSRGWKNLRLLSSANNTYNVDYHAEGEDGGQWPACNVFVNGEDGIRHFWAAELLYAKLDGEPRHMDTMWPLWSVLDITPTGRGTDWYPKLSYD